MGRGMWVGKRRGGRAGSFGSWFPREQSLSQERGLRRRDRANSAELLMSSAPYALSSGRCTPSLTLLLRPLSWLRDCNPSVKFAKAPRPSPTPFPAYSFSCPLALPRLRVGLNRAWFIFIICFWGRCSGGGFGCVFRIRWLGLDSGLCRPCSGCSFFPRPGFRLSDGCCLRGR